MTEVNVRASKKAATRQRLADAAIALFEKSGVEQVTISDIAAAANVGKGTLYNYYRSKEDILIEFLHAVELKLLPDVARPTNTRSLPKALHHASWTLLAGQAVHYTYARMVLARLVGGDAEFLARTSRFQGAINEAFATLFRRLQERKRIAAHWDPNDLALRFTVMHLGITAAWAMEGPPFVGTERMARDQTEIFARGIAP